MKQAFFLIPVFLLLALLEISFLAHFAAHGFIIPVVMIAVLVMSIFNPTSLRGLWGAFTGGFVLDVFSQHFFGYWIGIGVFLFLATTFIMKTYVRFPLFKRN